MTHLQIVFGGQGGQGVRLISTLLGKACAAAGRQVASSASYGPEVRGTYTRSEVIVSDEMIVYPRVLCPDILVALSQEAYERICGEVSAGGVILYESETVTPALDIAAEQHPLPAMQIAVELNAPRSANMVALGAVAAVAKLVDLEAIMGVLPGSRREENERALARGYEIGASILVDERGVAD